jgi:hypothetical protein
MCDTGRSAPSEEISALPQFGVFRRACRGYTRRIASMMVSLVLGDACSYRQRWQHGRFTARKGHWRSHTMPGLGFVGLGYDVACMSVSVSRYDTEIKSLRQKGDCRQPGGEWSLIS